MTSFSILSKFGQRIPVDDFSILRCTDRNSLTNGGPTAMPIEAAVENHELDAYMLGGISAYCLVS